MKAIMIMFDSLNKHMLPSYGCEWVEAPNFERLAEKTVTFDNSYVGSLPCMPARRELHTGRYNFLHRSWGPLEPFDDSMPEILKNNGVYTHLISDHFHYWEEGGSNYHTRYNTWEISRGQEGDPWIGQVKDPEIPASLHPKTGDKHWRQDWINRGFMKQEKNQPQAKTFNKGLEFLERNHKEDNWFLQIETFDPHEPFFSQDNYKEIYEHQDMDLLHFDWPPYGEVEDGEEVVEHVRKEYASLVSMCDNYLGQVLDMMDQNNMWKDTMLIINTDHGYLLGEHNCWAKSWLPPFNEIANTPLFIWDPRSAKSGERRESLVQTIDLAPTLLDFFEVDLPEDMQGKSLKQTISDDKSIRDAALFGHFGGHVNCTDGRYVYMRSTEDYKNQELYEYTLMPSHMKHTFSVEELKGYDISQPFDFTKGLNLMKIKSDRGKKQAEFPTMLYDLEENPKQDKVLEDSELEEKMIKHMVRLMQDTDAPKEQYIRLGLSNYINNQNQGE